MRAIKAGFAGLFLCAGLEACVAPAHKDSSPASASSFSRFASPPSGYVDYCNRNPHDCSRYREVPSEITLTDELWDKLRAVNFAVNRAIRPMDDLMHYGLPEFWTIPIDRRGDCDDFVVAKRKMLLLLGLPEPAIRISVVLLRNKIRHVVLVIVTDRGEFVLDNIRDDIFAPEATPYVWVQRQDPYSRTGWIRTNYTIGKADSASKMAALP